jgi:hypothetical protein
MNGKRDGFTLADFRACAKSALMKRGRAEATRVHHAMKLHALSVIACKSIRGKFNHKPASL